MKLTKVPYTSMNEFETMLRPKILYSTSFGSDGDNDVDTLNIIPSIGYDSLTKALVNNVNVEQLRIFSNNGFIAKGWKRDDIYLPLNIAIKWLQNGTSPVLYDLSLTERFNEDLSFLNKMNITYKMIKCFIGFADKDILNTLTIFNDANSVTDRVRAGREATKKLTFAIYNYERTLSLLKRIDCGSAIEKYSKKHNIRPQERLFDNIINDNRNEFIDVLKEPKEVDREIITDMSFKDKLLLAEHVNGLVIKLKNFIKKYNNDFKFKDNDLSYLHTLSNSKFKILDDDILKKMVELV